MGDAEAGTAHRLVETEGAGPVRVVKWSLPKFRAILKLAAGAVAGLSEKGLSAAGIVDRLSGDELEAILGYSLAEEDRQKVARFTVEDALDVAHAVIEMNFTEGLAKKARSLLPLAKSRLGLQAKTTP